MGINNTQLKLSLIYDDFVIKNKKKIKFAQVTRVSFLNLNVNFCNYMIEY